MTALGFLAADRSIAVDVADPALDDMLNLCRSSGRLEIGGILIGRYNEYGDRVVVMSATGPPRDSRRFPMSFIRGIAGVTRRLRRDWDIGLYYVGEWHFHPFASPDPSCTDLKQIKEFAQSADLRCPHPVLLVIGGDPNRDWSASAGVVIDGHVLALEGRALWLA